ncbi:hypothetical protein DNTS_035422 [Danionella cerebrum]|uniref:Methyltransferase domain-containing protein n=1 Tax=Danionella cerebrum TaxID=2873325 RepID=A0A553NWG5_9TELE|nr:hypothetical protein DNTS_035422 [Danionella translucida]
MMEYLPKCNARYKDVDYWNERYRTEQSFEWFGDFTKFEHLLKQHVGTEDNILMLGYPGNRARMMDGLSYDEGDDEYARKHTVCTRLGSYPVSFDTVGFEIERMARDAPLFPDPPQIFCIHASGGRTPEPVRVNLSDVVLYHVLSSPFAFFFQCLQILKVFGSMLWEPGKQSLVGVVLASLWQQNCSLHEAVSHFREPCCGNSALSHDMHQAGYSSITNVDYSSVCVEGMAERHQGCAQLSWICMDARRLAFTDASFDVVVEKGTLDAMLVEERDPWTVSENGAQVVNQVLFEVKNHFSVMFIMF